MAITLASLHFIDLCSLPISNDAKTFGATAAYLMLQKGPTYKRMSKTFIAKFYFEISCCSGFCQLNECGGTIIRSASGTVFIKLQFLHKL